MIDSDSRCSSAAKAMAGLALAAPPAAAGRDGADAVGGPAMATAGWAGAGAAGELGNPFVSQSGTAYFPTQSGGNFGVRRIEGTLAAAVFPASVVTTDAVFRDLPDATTAVEVKFATSNPGQYHLEDLTAAASEPKLMKSAAGYAAGTPPLGVPVGWGR